MKAKARIRGDMKVSIFTSKNFPIAEIDPRIYSGFIEHLGRAIYEGIYDPEHPTADADGFRADVAELVRELDMPFMRYPGGNFVSGYNWEDGVGPREKRPVRLDLAWKALEPNLVGTDDFMKWCKKAGTLPMMAVNLGTRGPAEAQALVEYCNHPKGTAWSDMRRANGADEPHAVKLWCLGNEMDGSWQTGAKTAQEYGRVAAEAAKMMKWTDDSIELIVCGSSGIGIPTFGQWEETVLEHTYEYADYISLHIYFGGTDGDMARFLASTEIMTRLIDGTIASCDAVRVRKKTAKKMMLSLDEWNTWYHSHGMEKKSKEWTVARPLLEDIYTLADAVVNGGALIAMLNRADRVKIACLAQAVNVIAPVMAEKNGPAWRQTTFFPQFYTSKFGRGTAMLARVDSPTHDATGKGVFADPFLSETPYVSAAVVHNTERKEMVVFAINRSMTEAAETEIHPESFSPTHVVEAISMHNEDLEATNSAKGENVKPQANETAKITAEGKVSISLPPVSWTMLRIAVE